jgi:hypothetical protein
MNPVKILPAKEIVKRPVLLFGYFFSRHKKGADPKARPDLGNACA